MKYLFFAVFFSVLVNCQTQDKSINVKLKNELAQIDRDDQMYRELMQRDISPEHRLEIMKEKNLTEEDATTGLGALMKIEDDKNLVKIEEIIKKYGYPGKSLVGEPENRTAWLVIQHSPKIDQYLPLIKKAADDKELPFRLYAMMLDRQLMYENKEQIYGTQGSYLNIMKDGKPETLNLIWPVKDAGEVNKRRKEAGFDKTIEEYAKVVFGKDFIYKKYTLSEVLELKKGSKK
jgi:hypothetical protein